MKNNYKFYISALALAAGLSNVQAQVFDKEQYQKALWMTARFYGSQRSGAGHSWLIAEHEPTKTTSVTGANLKAFVKGQDFVKDADGSYDLTGGWFDCGDHVKFGQTEFYAGYILALGYSEFPAGYDDYYSQNYDGYIAASDYTWEGKKGKPNGIPDILDELKYATDFFMKCVRDKGTFYYQVGDGDADHMVWCTSSVKATLSNSQGGEANGSRPIKKATGGTTSMTALCGATLASMSRSYRKFDPEYADKCLEKAKVAYEYVMGTSKGNANGGGYYPAKDKYLPDIVILCMELYRSTNDATYLSVAKENATWMAAEKDYNHNFSLCYNNDEDLACYLMAQYADDANAKKALAFYANMYKPSSGKILNKKNDGWGILRFPANQAFVLALNDKVNGEADKLNPYSLASIEYIMGSNGRKFSYIVGFGENYPHYPHHRNFYGLDNNDEGSLTTQPKFMQLGYMVGGSLDDGAYKDNEKEYTYSEGGIDYNSGLVASLGYINSIINTVNVNKFGHPTPELGKEISICGESSILLDSKVEAKGNMTFTWLLDGKEVAKSNKSTYEATKPGEYTCVLDSAGQWETSASVKVLGEMPTVTLEDGELCNPATLTLDANIDIKSATYNWTKDNEKISTSSTLEATQPGKYTCTISASGCDAISATATITSKLPEVTDASSFSNGKVTLKVNGEGEYEWYDQAEGGKLLASGNSFTTTIKENTKFYVQDAGSSSFIAGPDQKTYANAAGTNWGEIAAVFNANKALMITGMDLYLEPYSTGAQTVVFTLSHNGKKQTFNSKSIDVSNKGWYTVELESPVEISEAGQYELSAKPSNSALPFYQSGSPYSTFKNNGEVIEFTGASNGTASQNPFPAMVNWQIVAGSGCGRAVVNATYNPNGGTESSCAAVSNNICEIYPNPAKEEIFFNVKEEGTAKVEIISINGSLVKATGISNTNEGISVANLSKGIYTVRVITSETVYMGQFIKE